MGGRGDVSAGCEECRSVSTCRGHSPGAEPGPRVCGLTAGLSATFVCWLSRFHTLSAHRVSSGRATGDVWLFSNGPSRATRVRRHAGLSRGLLRWAGGCRSTLCWNPRRSETVRASSTRTWLPRPSRAYCDRTDDKLARAPTRGRTSAFSTCRMLPGRWGTGWKPGPRSGGGVSERANRSGGGRRAGTRRDEMEVPLHVQWAGKAC